MKNKKAKARPFPPEDFDVCPVCGEYMEEHAIGRKMTGDREADDNEEFDILFECPNCGHCKLCDIGGKYYADESEIEELIDIISVNPRSFEDVIENALKSKCFIEAISLIHNTIELYLKLKLDNFFDPEKERYNLLKEKVKFKYLKDYSGFCYILGLISKKDHNLIIKFNRDRNKAIHDLLKKEIATKGLRAIARRGRKMQLILSPIQHSLKDIKKILARFDKLTK